MIDSQRPIINPEFILEKFDNEILLYSVSETKAVYLNEAAHLIWALSNEQLSIGEIIGFLEEKYPTQKKTIRNDVISALESLCSQGVITLVD
jgi:hypothetical protein